MEKKKWLEGMHNSFFFLVMGSVVNDGVQVNPSFADHTLSIVSVEQTENKGRR
jgi:hypothetical protein